MKPTETTLEEDLDEIDKDTREMLQKNIIDSVSASEYTVMGDNVAWDEALKSQKVPNIVSVKKRKNENNGNNGQPEPPKKKKKRKKNSKKTGKKIIERKKLTNNKENVMIIPLFIIECIQLVNTITKGRFV